VPDAATPGSLYYGKLVPLGVDALRRTVEAIRDGTLTETPQDESLATYEPPFPALQRSAAAR
jgi:methionyl-tRNA formyltransferase